MNESFWESFFGISHLLIRNRNQQNFISELLRIQAEIRSLDFSFIRFAECFEMTKIKGVVIPRSEKIHSPEREVVASNNLE